MLLLLHQQQVFMVSDTSEKIFNEKTSLLQVFSARYADSGKKLPIFLQISGIRDRKNPDGSCPLKTANKRIVKADELPEDFGLLIQTDPGSN